MAVAAASLQIQGLQVTNENVVDAEKWLRARLTGLSPADFPEGFAIYTTLPMEVPTEFRFVSRAILPCHSTGRLEDGEARFLSSISAVLVFCDIRDIDQVELAVDLDNCVAQVLGMHGPPTILVTHSSNPELQSFGEDAEFAALSDLMRQGFGAVVVGEPSGIRLALQIQSTILDVAGKASAFNVAVAKHREKVQHAKNVENRLGDTVWVYLKRRLRLEHIPRRDFSVDACRPGAWLDNLRVASRLGKGAHGAVYKLENSEQGHCPTGQVVKAILKKPITSLQGLGTLSNEIRVMQELSSETWEHPNIIKLHEVYHSDTEVLLRMEDGGSRNLYSYLKTHEMKRFPLGTTKAKSIIMQCMAGISHMHLGPGIVHRDIKTENIVACETPQGLRIKLCDFDLSCIMRPGGLCTSTVGTFPFMAPELMDGKQYDPFAADMWSMAVVFLEVLCSVRVVEEVATAGRKPANEAETVDMTRDIRKFFANPHGLKDLLDAHLRPELKGDIDGTTQSLLKGMLHVQPSERWTAGAFALMFDTDAIEALSRGNSERKEQRNEEQCNEAVKLSSSGEEPCGSKRISNSKALQPIPPATRRNANALYRRTSACGGMIRHATA